MEGVKMYYITSSGLEISNPHDFEKFILASFGVRITFVRYIYDGKEYRVFFTCHADDIDKMLHGMMDTMTGGIKKA